MSADPRKSNDAARRVADLASDLETYHRRYEAEHDSRAVFAYAYFNLTCDLAERLADPDAFDDPTWVADLAVAFGSQYVSAMDAIDEWQRDSDTPGDSLYRTIPRPWTDVYRAICRERSTVLEDLVFAMCAHITHDLPYALLDTGVDPDHLADFHRMNEVLASRTDAVQAAVTDRYNRTLSRFDRFAGGADEVFTNYWIRIGRCVAWYNAMRLQSPLARPQAEKAVKRATYYIIDSARSAGPWPLRVGLKLYRTALPFTRRWPNPAFTSADGWSARESRW